MNTQRQTPGQWKIEEGLQQFTIFTDDMTICEVLNIDTPYEEGEANAKLIASAPLLLEALTEMYNMYQKLTENTTTRIGWDVAAKAKRAIEKATK